MKIYEFKHNVRGGETDWVCAPNIKKARDFYSSETGIDSFEDTIVKALTKKELENRNGWYYSQQGLILTDDENENIRGYLSEVYRLNEIDDKNQKEFEMIKRLYEIWNKS
jgi:hypothetical protein